MPATRADAARRSAAPPSRPCPPARASTFVISITPFAADGELDEQGVRQHLRRMASAGVGVYLGGGGSGEGYVLSQDETRRLLEIGVDEIAGQVPLRAMGTEPRSADEMIAFTRLAAAAGVDAVQIYSLDQGHGHRPRPGEVETYFTDVLDAVSVPSVLSTHQSVGYQVPVELLARLVERYEHLIGLNVTHQDLGYLADVVDAVGDRVDVHVGGPGHALSAWSLGACGYLSSEANLAPGLCMSVVHAYRSGDAEALTTSFGQLIRLSRALYGAGGIRATKAVLGRLGLPGGPPRKPQLPVPDSDATAVLRLCEQLGVTVGLA